MGIPGLSVDFDSDVPVYRQIADGIRLAAGRGRLVTGARLPPTRDLARQLKVNRNTVVAAYDTLVADGWVESHTGKGTFLVARPERDSTPTLDDADDAWFTAFSRTADLTAASGLQSIYRLAIATEGIPFVGSYPAAELLPADAFREALDEALRRDGSSILAYGPTAGHPPLRETIAAAMREAGSPVGPADLLITNGAQQAVELVFRAFVDSGDAVVVEEPTYTGALSALTALGARVVGVPGDDEGIRADLLELALERHRPRLMYLQPTFHNPTTREMSAARRNDVLAIAARHRCPVVEDDWAGDLRFEGHGVPTLHALDRGRHVIYLSTFSKKLLPALRIGWVAAPPRVLERLVELKRLEDCGTSPLLQAALDVFVRGGGLASHLSRVRPAYLARRDAMLAALARHFPSEATWTRPRGGLFLWLALPAGFDGHELFVAARQHGVLYSRGELFHSDGTGTNALRLAYSAAAPEQIETGIEILGRLVAERLDRRVAREPLEAVPIL